jgi:hypothetical protein
MCVLGLNDSICHWGCGICSVSYQPEMLFEPLFTVFIDISQSVLRVATYSIVAVLDRVEADAALERL